MTKRTFTKIIVDYEKKVIYWGDLYTQDIFIKNLNWKLVSKTLGYYKGFSYNYRNKFGKKVYCEGSGTKETNQALTKVLGISPKKFTHMLKGAQYKLWIKGKEDLISKLCVVHGKWNYKKINILNKNWYIIQQYKEDGLDNLIPIAMYLGKSTQELKQELGKSLWKSICNNSFYRNKFIANKFNYLGTGNINDLKILNKIPTSIYRYNIFDIHTNDSLIWSCEILKQRKLLTKGNRYLPVYNDLYIDTKRMANKLETAFNPDWSEKKMREKHDEYTIIIQAKRYPDEFIECLKDIPIKVIHHYGLTAKLLDTPFKIALQGKDQHHCVANYIDEVKRGNYLVYDIWDDKLKERVSTLGINIRYTDHIISWVIPSLLPKIEINDGIPPQCYEDIKQAAKREFTFSQHYKKYNASVRDDDHRWLTQDEMDFPENYPRNRFEHFANDIIRELNKRQYGI